jgi:uncharacterized delta-60 repeat protein
MSLMLAFTAVLPGSALGAKTSPSDAGDLDPSFGVGGMVTTDYGGADNGRDMVIQPDGKIVVAGFGTEEFQIARYETDGSLDPTFGGGDGLVATSFGGIGGSAVGIALQSDGKLVLAGTVIVSIARYAIGVARYTADGALDGSFSGDGIVTTRVDSLNSYGEAVAIQSDGRIAVAGWLEDALGDNDVVVARYLADGTPDPQFGTDGAVSTDTGSGDDVGRDLIVIPNGDLVVAGSATTDVGGHDFLLIRYNVDGSLDSGFGGDGLVTTNTAPSSSDNAFGVARQGNGMLIAVGDGAGFLDQDFTAIRYQSDGSLDPAFDGDGIAKTNFGQVPSNDLAFDVVLQPDGGIVVVGVEQSIGFGLVRYNPDGSLDSSFGDDGKVITYTADPPDEAWAVSLQEDAKIVAAGVSYGLGDFVVARYEGASPIATTLTLLADPDRIDLGEAVTISGTLSFADGDSVDGRTIHITRTNPDGSETTLADQVTDSGGNFSTSDTPESFGQNIYTATFDGDEIHDDASAQAFVQVVTTGTPSDFDGDGLSDLAVGVPWEDLGGVIDAGAMNVVYATDAGLASAGNQFWDQAGMGTGANELLDGLGFASVSGDFDGDGFADLAAATPGKTVGGDDFAGSVNVVYGSAAGLTSSGSQQWTQDSADVEGSASVEDYFGWSVAAGDFNGDRFDDLAVGVPGEPVGGDAFAGAVSVLYGSASGLTASGDQIWNQDSSGINNGAEPSDQFGLAVGTGDFDGNGFDDLAVGVPTENLEDKADVGAVNVIYGTAGGLSSTGDDFWNQGVTDINSDLDADDWFGYRVAGGDFDGDGFDDLLSGVPAEDLSGGVDAGGASAIYGSASGLSAAGDDFWNQDSDGINDTAQAGDEFGVAVVAGNFDGDGYDDAAIGVPGELISGADGAGGVSVIYGTSGGLDDPNDDFWKQSSSDIEEDAEGSDLFGYGVMAANFGNGPEDDLAIGVVLESVGSVEFAGAVNVIYGSPSDLTATGDQLWSQNSTDILDSAEFDDEFGFGLAQRGGGGSLGPQGPSRFVQAPVA